MDELPLRLIAGSLHHEHLPSKCTISLSRLMTDVVSKKRLGKWIEKSGEQQVLRCPAKRCLSAIAIRLMLMMSAQSDGMDMALLFRTWFNIAFSRRNDMYFYVFALERISTKTSISTAHIYCANCVRIVLQSGKLVACANNANSLSFGLSINIYCIVCQMVSGIAELYKWKIEKWDLRKCYFRTLQWSWLCDGISMENLVYIFLNVDLCSNWVNEKNRLYIYIFLSILAFLHEYCVTRFC